MTYSERQRKWLAKVESRVPAEAGLIVTEREREGKGLFLGEASFGRGEGNLASTLADRFVVFFTMRSCSNIYYIRVIRS